MRSISHRWVFACLVSLLGGAMTLSTAVPAIAAGSDGETMALMPSRINGRYLLLDQV